MDDKLSDSKSFRRIFCSITFISDKMALRLKNQCPGIVPTKLEKEIIWFFTV